MTPVLRNALEKVYEELRAPTPGRIDGCPCCIDRKEVRVLHTRNLRDLSEQDLGSYAASVFLTVGELQDFRYFLPRILELAILNPGGFSIGVEVVLGKLALANWKAWAKPEQAAVRNLIDLWFDEVALDCATDWDGYDNTLDDLLCAIARSGLEPVDYIERLLPEERRFALNVLWEKNRGDITRKGRLCNAFWKDEPVAQAAVIDRLQAPDVQAIVA